ncbi:MAG: PAS domain-containing protein, partial [Candidatus Krumholzibacteriota bacterium]|nr:PAS domain-containing protein [Candidatus Krumholzibacteriota bacterium]
VAKIDLAEIRAPFIKTGLSAAAVALLVILAGTALFFLIGNPIIARLEAYSRDLEKEIEEHRRAEEALGNTNEKLKISIDNMPNAYILCDTESLVLEWNKAAELIFGYSKAEMLGKNVFDLFVPEKVRHPVGAAVKKLKVGEVADYSGKDNNIRKDGKLISCLWYNSPLADKNGKVFGILFMAQDVTDRNRAEAALKRSEERLQLSIQKMPIAFVVWDTEWRITEWNNEAENIFGFTKAEVLGNSVLDRIVPEAARPMVAGLMPKFKERRSVHYSEPNNNIRKDGKLISCRWSNTPLSNESGEVFAVLSMAEDVTELKRAEEEIRQHTKDLTLLNELNNALNRGDDINEVIQFISDRTKELFSCFGSLILLLDDDGAQLRMKNMPLDASILRKVEESCGRTVPLFSIPYTSDGVHFRIMRSPRESAGRGCLTGHPRPRAR